MKLNLYFIIYFITIFGTCISRKSGLYPDQNNDNNSSDEEIQQQEYNDYDGSNYENNYEQPVKKSGLNDNDDNQYQDSNIDENYDNSQMQYENNQNNEEQKQASIKTRHQYKLSFKKPYYYYNDTSLIPNWVFAGDVIPSTDMIRLVPSVPNKSGSIWSLQTNHYDEWQVILSLRITGRGLHGSQGIGFFYTDHRLKTDVFFGSETTWNGLAIIFDTLNRDKNSNIPTISVLYNDGNTTIRSQKDYESIRKSTCVADFRNSPAPVYVRITYANKNLKVEVDLTHGGLEYYECTNDKIELPKEYVYGVSAKTGSENPDDHDILSFDFYQINPPPKEIKYRPIEEEIINREGEFKIDEQTLENIKKVQEEIDKKDQKKKEEEMKERFIDARTVHMTQFRILETVNRILSNIQDPQFKSNSGNDISLDDLNHASEQIMYQQQEMTENFEGVKQQIENMNDSMERNSQKFEYKLNSVEVK
eukprot:jgi/Orpsp1_1/1188107/evm.model.d7180000062478.1